MKLSLLALSAFVTGAMANMDDLRRSRRLNKEFMDAMHANPRVSDAQKKNRAQKIRKLHEDLIKASRKLANNQYSEYQQQAYSDQQQYYEQQQQYQQNLYQQNGQQQQYQQQNGQGNQYQYQQSGQGNQYQYQQNGQGNQYQYQQDQAYSDVGTWNGQYWEFNSEVPFDLSSRAFKYSGCAAIKTYDEDNAYGNGNPLVMDTYAVFRLCPASKCNKYSVTGCGKNYGEYAVEMKTYLSYVLGFYDERYQDYCEYCEPCDYEYEAIAKSSLQQCYVNFEKMTYATAQQQQQSAWQDYYNANNGDMSGWNVNGGDQNFQNYNNYYNEAHNYNGYYNNARTGSGANYNGNSNSASNGAYSSGNGNRKLEDAGNGDDASANANDANGYYDQDGNYVDGNANEQAGDNADGYDTVNGYWGADGIWYPYQNGNSQGGMQYQQCKDGSLCDACEARNEELYLPCDDYICNDYYTYCSDLYGETNTNFDASQFLECTEYENQYGQTYYIGPHCGSDHYTISLGVYKDENCLEYIGEDISLSSVLGFTYNNDDLFQLPKECISCDGAEDYEENANSGEGRYGDYVSSPATDEGGVVAVCRALYEGSAQCNMNMNNFELISRYMSTYEIDIEKRYCSFIENIINGVYDESGDILLKPDSFDFAEWRNPQQYKKLKMPASQAIYLSLSIIVCIAAAATAIFTRRSLTRTASPWRPKRMSPNEISGVPSGIGMTRSQSGPGNAPLI